MVLAADHVGDARVEVVDGDGEVVEDRAVRPGDHGVVEVDVAEARLAPDEVADHGLPLVGDVQAHRALRLCIAAKAALVAVARLERLDVVGGGGRAVRRARLQELREDLAVALGALGLEHGSLVPVDLQPAQGVEDLLHVLGSGALAVGVLDPQDQGVRLPARGQPVVERGAGAADVQGARGRRGEAQLHPD